MHTVWVLYSRKVESEDKNSGGGLTANETVKTGQGDNGS